MADSRLRRAAQSLRDPWSPLIAAVGAGVAWAVALPVGGIGAIGIGAGVGVGMLGVAAVVAAARPGPPPEAERPEPVLRTGTPQFALVGVLESYLADLIRLQAGAPAPVLSSQATDAVEAARSARTVAFGVAASVDALDGALDQAGQVARQMTAVHKIAAPVDRMLVRRTELLGKLTSAVDGVGELYAKLLELSTTPGFAGDAATDHGPDPVAEVNQSLDLIRGAFAELDTAARATTARLNSPEPL